MGSRGWPGAPAWAQRARRIAPTIVGGSTRHSGPDLGPTRARQAWKALGVDGRGIADHAPGPGHPAAQPPRLTTRMVARLQGFPDSWEFSGRKTAAYRQIGNAFPPPVAAALDTAIAAALGQAHPRRRPRAGQRARLERTDVRPAATAGLDESAGTSSGLSLPTVTARRSSDTRYPPICTSWPLTG